MSQGYKPWRMVFSYSAAHFIVDFSCALLMFGSLAGRPNWQLCVLLYNFCAFAMQMPLGALVDVCNRNARFAAAGCLLVAAAFPVSQIALAAALLAGIGNGLFHVGAGVDVLNISEEKSSALGVFVSPGAFGIYAGTVLGKGGGFPAPFALAMPLLALLLIARAQGSRRPPANAKFSLQSAASPHSLFAAGCLFLVVCLRSYVGLSLQFPWKSSGFWGVALVSAVVFGKAAGGFAADAFGARRVSALSLSAAALLFLLPAIPAAGILSLLLFNMTMPITLWLMSKIFPAAKGFSFGVLTFGLFIGYVPKYLAVGIPSAPWVFALLAGLSLALLSAGAREIRR